MDSYPFILAKDSSERAWHEVLRPYRLIDKEARQLMAAARSKLTLQPGEVAIARGEHSVHGIFDMYFQGQASQKIGNRETVDIVHGFILRTRDPAFHIVQEHLDSAFQTGAKTLKRYGLDHAWDHTCGMSDEVIELRAVAGKSPLRAVGIASIPKIGTAPLPISEAHWTDRVRAEIVKPRVKGVVVAAAVATIAVGAYLVASHLRRTTETEVQSTRSRL